MFGRYLLNAAATRYGPYNEFAEGAATSYLYYMLIAFLSNLGC